MGAVFLSKKMIAVLNFDFEFVWRFLSPLGVYTIQADGIYYLSAMVRLYYPYSYTFRVMVSIDGATDYSPAMEDSTGA